MAALIASTSRELNLLIGTENRFNSDISPPGTFKRLTRNTSDLSNIFLEPTNSDFGFVFC